MTRTLTVRELNRALLARQMLLERVQAPLPRALERMAGLQAQYAPSMYIGLWTRLEGFAREQLTRALERRSVIQASMMRATIHLVSKRDYWPFARDPPGAEDLVAADARPRPRAEEGLGERPQSRRALADGTLSRAEIDSLLGEAVDGVGLFLDLVRVPPSGTWERRRADLYAAAENWVGPESATEADGIELLVRRYLQGFGPARPAEIADWASLDVKTVRQALERLDCGASRTRTAESSSTSRGCRCPTRTRPLRCASCPSGTRRCSSTRGGRRSFPSATGLVSSTSAPPTP